jgi:multiple antibiotic resistance protein
MTSALEFFVVCLSAIFVVVDPIAATPMVATMTAGRDRAEVRSIVKRATLVGALLLVLFTLFGGVLFRLLHIELSAFRVAGGVLLLLTALDMLRGKLSSCKCSAEDVEDARTKPDIAIVPLATPLLAGPGAIATVMVLVSENGDSAPVFVILAILVTFAASYFVLRSAELVQRALRKSGMALVQRVMGLVLAAVSIQFIADGARQLFGLD